MRNFPSAFLLTIGACLWATYGFHWYYLILLAGSLLFSEYPVKENIEYLKVQIEESKVRTENIRWAIKLSETTVKLNLATLAMMQHKK